MMRLKRVCISHLAFIILNGDSNDVLRKYAEVELKKRLKQFSVYYDDLLHDENRKMKVRGFDINEYLFSSDPNMQQLMELYFMYVCCNNWNDNMLLFSEKHLCNQMDFGVPFFNEICDNEMRNILIRLEDSDISEVEKTNLEVFYKLLKDRQTKMNDEKNREFGGINRVEYNEALLYFDDYDVNNNCNLISRLKDLRVILSDDRRLNEQRRILLAQSSYGHVVHYDTDNMQKSLARIKNK